MAVELTTVPTETTLDLINDRAWLNDVSETPDAINQAALWRFSQVKAADIASAATLNLDASTGDLVDVTGTTTITAITLTEGRKMTVRFTGILTLTHGASLVLPNNGSNITTAAGDYAIFRGYAAGVVRCVVYQRASGAALAGGGSTASTTEVLTGTDNAKSVTPDALAALWEQGSDIASAATISVGEGGYFNVTGTTTIIDVDFATDKAGRKVWLKFAGILTLTHHATTLILPTGANIVTAAGDIACFVSEGSDNVRCVSYTRASGAALAGGGIGGSTGATDNAIVRADGTGGSTVQSSGAEVNDSGYVGATAGANQVTPNFYCITDTNTGIALIGGDNMCFVSGGAAPFGIGGTTIQVPSGVQYGFSSSGGAALSAANDTGLARVIAKFVGVTDGSTGGGGLSFVEMTAPAAPAANGCYLYTEDNGSGKTRLMALFSSGASQQIAIQP